MSIIDLRRRLDRIESARHVGAPTCVVADYPVEDEEADNPLANWRFRVAQGSASALNGVLYLTEASEMSESDWVARHVTQH